MTQDTKGKVANSQFYTTNESQEVSRFSPWARRGHHAPLKALWKWYIIVHWTPLVRNEDGNTRYRGSHPPWFQDGRHEKRQNAYIVTGLYQPPTIFYVYVYERIIYMYM